MPVKLSEHFNISSKLINDTGVLDVILDVDTRFFIDPALLKFCDIPEFSQADSKVKNYFSKIIRLLRASTKEGDLCWKSADRLLTFHELSGTCLGYSKSGTSGNSIGKVLRQNILSTIKEIIELGESDPELFELLVVFQDNLGCDRISDLITFILRDEIYRYTQRVSIQLNISNMDLHVGTHTYRVCFNPYNKKPLLLLPKIILSPLTTAQGFNDIDLICHENRRVREEMNNYFDFGRKTKFSKDDILYFIRSFSFFRNTFITGYKTYPATIYDFEADPSGEYIWYEASKSYMQRFPLTLSPGSLNNTSDVLLITKQICGHFKTLIEDNGLSSLLYDDSNGKAKKESASQLLFFGIASFCCSANNIDLTREGNNGRGPVDFKLSRGSEEKILVEVKLTSSSQLKHGIEKQLPIYMKQERVKKAIYLIIDTGHPKALSSFEDFYRSLDKDTKEKIEYIVIDATPKLSASKA